MKSRRERALIASFSSDTSIDPCATFKRESGNWRIDQAAWGHPASPAQLLGPVAVCLLSDTHREKASGEGNYSEIYCQSLAICYVQIKNIKLHF